jgi:2Fe-2S ferredoxin
MPKIIFVEHDGKQHVVEADVGQSVMQAAVGNMVPGIVGDCGGCCTCATCHAHFAEGEFARVGQPSEDERLMLEGALDVRPTSRLTCQITVSAELDGLTVLLPKAQF